MLEGFFDALPIDECIGAAYAFWMARDRPILYAWRFCLGTYWSSERARPPNDATFWLSLSA